MKSCFPLPHASPTSWRGPSHMCMPQNDNSLDHPVTSPWPFKGLSSFLFNHPCTDTCSPCLGSFRLCQVSCLGSFSRQMELAGCASWSDLPLQIGRSFLRRFPDLPFLAEKVLADGQVYSLHLINVQDFHSHLLSNLGWSAFVNKKCAFLMPHFKHQRRRAPFLKKSSKVKQRWLKNHYIQYIKLFRSFQWNSRGFGHRWWPSTVPRNAWWHPAFGQLQFFTKATDLGVLKTWPKSSRPNHWPEPLTELWSMFHWM